MCQSCPASISGHFATFTTTNPPPFGLPYHPHLPPPAGEVRGKYFPPRACIGFDECPPYRSCTTYGDRHGAFPARGFQLTPWAASLVWTLNTKPVEPNAWPAPRGLGSRTLVKPSTSPDWAELIGLTSRLLNISNRAGGPADA